MPLPHGLDISPHRRGRPPCLPKHIPHHNTRRGRPELPLGFSPLFVGAVVAIWHSRGTTPSLSCFSPLFVGAGVAMELDHPSHVGSEEFQSPICRGRRCNNETLPANQYRGLFQSPIRRGSRCNRPLQPVSLPIEVSVPYSSGQSLQSSAAPHRHWSWHGFSPLFVGAVVAIRGGPRA